MSKEVKRYAPMNAIKELASLALIASVLGSLAYVGLWGGV